jgi:hypothetical protein
MDLSKFLNELFAGKASAFHMGANLHRRRLALMEAFGRFGQGLANCKDPPFFAKAISVDLKSLDQGLVAVIVYGSDEISFCLDVVQVNDDYGGKVRCILRSGYELAKFGKDAAQVPIGSWSFDWRGITDVHLSNGEALTMNEPSEAVALAIGVLLAVHTEGFKKSG